ncbi:hypothetical protein ACFL37_00180 [Candidatus Margulisiibacteriota bacterium]
MALIFLCASPCWARSDSIDSLMEWEAYYFRFKICGYPVYNEELCRYDFYDLDECYTGSLCFNPLTEDWEYFGL